jgi:hypothetical protein
MKASKILKLELAPLDRKVILEDQEGALRSFHASGIYRDCRDFSQCPLSHFSEVTFDEIRTRQQIIKKLKDLRRE